MTVMVHCRGCGKDIHETAVTCPACGAPQHQVMAGASLDKKILPAFLLSFFIGVFGIHRFYVGKTGTGLIMLLISLTFFGLIITSIWNLIDWIMIISGSFKDADGKYLKEWT
jgi:TM2 domain-containing membrane protein YozV